MFRNALPDIFVQFDCADPTVVTTDRTTGIVAGQALFLLNNNFIHEQSRRAAEQILSSSSLNSTNLDLVYTSILGTPPPPSVRRIFAEYLENCIMQKIDPVQAWTDIYQSIFASIEFRFVN